MIRPLLRYALIASVVGIGLGGCEKQLTVTNPNSPDAKKALSSPADLENFLGSYYKRWHSGMYGALGNVWGMAAVQSFEDFSTLSNNCMGQRVGIPRAANDNTLGNICKDEQLRVYQFMNEVQRVASSVLAQLNETGYTLGSTAQDARAKAFAQFLRGLAIGYVGMTYDSSAVIDETMAAEDPGELKGYPELQAASMDAFQKSIDFMSACGTSGTAAECTLPATWIPSSTVFNPTEFVKLVRSYRARIRANMARTPAERAAVNWDLVIADAQNGITADHDNITATVGGPFKTWVAQFDGAGTWHQMTPFVIGMGDVSGAYAAWTAAPLDKRGPDFTMVTPDLRFPQGANRAAQQADFASSSCQGASQVCKRYYVNRPNGGDPGAQISWGGSNYDFVRFHSWRVSGDGTAQNGKIVFVTLAEMDMLRAEGLIRKGDFAGAAALINKTRVKNGLPAITALDNTSPVPGGTDNCVPKVPTALTGPLKCGNMFEAMKWEKRLETQYTHFMAWFLDSRGWGDLPEGTGLHWPTPYQDLQVRGRSGTAIYSTGGGTNPASAAKGTYGW
jgi:hypothetical protein